MPLFERSEIRDKSPCEKRALRSFQTSSAFSIHMMLLRMETETECTSQDATMLL